MSNSYYDDFESLAASVRADLGIPFDERPDPIDLLRRARIRGLIRDYKFVDSGELGGDFARWDRDARVIYINAEKRVEIEAGTHEGTFTVFHELAHVLLHHHHRARRLGGTIQFGRHIEQDEADADRLAAALMAPYELANVDEHTTPEILAARFRLPMRHATLRMEELLRMLRKRKGTKRLLPGSEARVIDTGDYNEAGSEMMRNAMRWNSRDQD